MSPSQQAHSQSAIGDALPSWLTTTHAPQETAALGECLGRVLERGDVVLLSGELGAGKTVFAQGLGRGLGTPTLVRSSSFVLLSEHAEGRLPLFHADLYRLADSEVADLFLDEEAADGVLLVEWPERWEEGAPADHLRIQFDTNLDAGADPPQKITDDRTIILTARGPASGALLQRFLNPDRGPN